MTEFDIYHNALRILFLTSLGLLIGCSRTTENSAARVPVSGKLLIDQRPLQYALLEFVPDDPEGSQVSTVMEEGVFRLPQEQGLTPGLYNVAVLRYAPENVDGISAEQQREMAASRALIPERYQSPGALTVVIEADKTNDLTLNLVSQKKR